MKKKEAQYKYQGGKELKNSIRQDKRKYMEDLATKGEEAVDKRNIKELQRYQANLWQRKVLWWTYQGQFREVDNQT